MAIESSRQITVSLYEQAGGARGILRGHLDRVIQREVPASLRPNARRLIETLVTADKRRALRTIENITSELAPYGVTEEEVQTLTHTLVDSRLLSVGEGDNGSLAFELAHDYLLEEIELDPDVQARKTAKELLMKKLPYYLSNGILLNEAELAIISAQYKWLALSRDEDRLIQDSRRAIDRRRLLLYGLGTAIVSVIVCALVMILLLQTWSAQDLRVANMTSDANSVFAQEQLALARTAQADQEIALAEAEIQRANAEAERAAAEQAQLQALAAQQEAEANLAAARAAEAREAEQRALAEGNLGEAERQRLIAEENEALAGQRRQEAEINRAQADAQAEIARVQAEYAQQQANAAATAQADALAEANENATAQARAESEADANATAQALAEQAAFAEQTQAALARSAQAEALANAAIAALGAGDLAQAYQYAIEAYDLDPTLPAVQNAVDTVVAAPLPLYEIIPDGDRFFVAKSAAARDTGTIVIRKQVELYVMQEYLINLNPTSITAHYLGQQMRDSVFHGLDHTITISSTGSFIASHMGLFYHQNNALTAVNTNGVDFSLKSFRWSGQYLGVYLDYPISEDLNIYQPTSSSLGNSLATYPHPGSSIDGLGALGECVIVGNASGKQIDSTELNSGCGLPLGGLFGGATLHPTDELAVVWGPNYLRMITPTNQYSSPHGNPDAVVIEPFSLRTASYHNRVTASEDDWFAPINPFSAWTNRFELLSNASAIDSYVNWEPSANMNASVVAGTESGKAYYWTTGTLPLASGLDVQDIGLATEYFGGVTPVLNAHLTDDYIITYTRYTIRVFSRATPTAPSANTSVNYSTLVVRLAAYQQCQLAPTALLAPNSVPHPNTSTLNVNQCTTPAP